MVKVLARLQSVIVQRDAPGSAAGSNQGRIESCIETAAPEI
jgi:hypothetical protein